MELLREYCQGKALEEQEIHGEHIKQVSGGSCKLLQVSPPNPSGEIFLLYCFVEFYFLKESTEETWPWFVRIMELEKI